jgi:hypothetical protein
VRLKQYHLAHVVYAELCLLQGVDHGESYLTELLADRAKR